MAKEAEHLRWLPPLKVRKVWNEGVYFFLFFLMLSVLRGVTRRGRSRDDILSLFLDGDKGEEGRWNSCQWDGDRGRTSPTPQRGRTWDCMTSLSSAHTIRGPLRVPPGSNLARVRNAASRVWALCFP